MKLFIFFILNIVIAATVSALTFGEVWTGIVTFVRALDAEAGKLNRWAEKRL